MRIITGTARGTKLATLEGIDTRPTTEMCKEGVFSAIQFDIQDKSVLDLFSGSGQMALEALSRGAEKAVMIDNSRRACEIIKENAAKTKLIKQCRIACADWKEYLRGVKGKERFDIVFLDPPYTDGLLDEILARIKTSEILSDNSIIIAESSKTGIPSPVEGWNSKLYHYGKTFVTIYRLGTEV